MNNNLMNADAKVYFTIYIYVQNYDFVHSMRNWFTNSIRSPNELKMPTGMKYLQLPN